MSEPVGRWMRLENVLSKPVDEARGGVSKSAHRKHRKRGTSSSTWVVLYPGVPAVGQKISVSKASGEVQERYVQQVVASALQRGDGRSVVAVSATPVMPRERPLAAPLPAPAQPPMLRQRNPRVCEECEGPCRPGAGVCDGCKGARRSARVAEDGAMLRATRSIRS